jgi:hypothetical protein
MSRQVSQHGELIFDVLRYATRLLADGDESGLLDMGFTSEQIREIETLTLKSLQRVGQLGAHFMDFRIDPACFARVMRRIEQEREDEALKDALLLAGAPIRMMHHYWGMTSRDCAERRRVLDVDAPIGRPPQADDAALEALWHLWQDTSGITDERQRYLELSKRSDLSLTAIWIAVEEWNGDAGTTTRDHATGPVESAPSRMTGPRRVVELNR